MDRTVYTREDMVKAFVTLLDSALSYETIKKEFMSNKGKSSETFTNLYESLSYIITHRDSLTGEVESVAKQVFGSTENLVKAVNEKLNSAFKVVTENADINTEQSKGVHSVVELLSKIGNSFKSSIKEDTVIEHNKISTDPLA